MVAFVAVVCVSRARNGLERNERAMHASLLTRLQRKPIDDPVSE